MSKQASMAEDELIKAAQGGDQTAFQTLVTQYQAAVLRFLYRLGNDVPTAQDLAQEAFLKAWLSIDKYHHQRQFKSWLFKITYHLSIDFWRRQRPTVELTSTQTADTQTDPEYHLNQVERSNQVRQAVQALPDQSRAVIILREYHQFSYKEIADTLDIPQGTVMSRLHYARILLKKHLQPLMENVYDRA